MKLQAVPSHPVVKPILSSPKTEEEHKLFSNLDKVRSLWTGDQQTSNKSTPCPLDNQQSEMKKASPLKINDNVIVETKKKVDCSSLTDAEKPEESVELVDVPNVSCTNNETTDASQTETLSKNEGNAKTRKRQRSAKKRTQNKKESQTVDHVQQPSEPSNVPPNKGSHTSGSATEISKKNSCKSPPAKGPLNTPSKSPNPNKANANIESKSPANKVDKQKNNVKDLVKTPKKNERGKNVNDAIGQVKSKDPGIKKPQSKRNLLAEGFLEVNGEIEKSVQGVEVSSEISKPSSQIQKNSKEEFVEGATCKSHNRKMEINVQSTEQLNEKDRSSTSRGDKKRKNRHNRSRAKAAGKNPVQQGITIYEY